MENTYIFSNWTSVNQMVNYIDPERKASGSAIINQIGDSKEVVGYELTIHKRGTILYKVRVETGDKGEWSLNTEDAVDFLNQLGFRCQYNLPEYYSTLTSRQYSILKSLKELGYSHIVRYFIDGQGHVIALKSESYDEDHYDLSSTPDYNYIDWIFLELGDIISIEELIKGNTDN